jgi:hypothetical protein
MLPTSGTWSMEKKSKANMTTTKKKKKLFLLQLKIIHFPLHASRHKHIFNTSVLENHSTQKATTKQLKHQTDHGNQNFQSRTKN